MGGDEPCQGRHRRSLHAGIGARSNDVSGATVFTPPPAALSRLRSVHFYVGRLAETIPEMLTNTKFAHDLEYRLIAVMQETLSARASGPDTAARRHHQLIIRRFREVLEAQADVPLHIPEISQKIGVSSRTLRSACQH
jgi:hypothetical protein